MRRDRRRSKGGGALDEDQGVGRAETVVRSEKKQGRALDEDEEEAGIGDDDQGIRRRRRET